LGKYGFCSRFRKVCPTCDGAISRIETVNTTTTRNGTTYTRSSVQKHHPRKKADYVVARMEATFAASNALYQGHWIRKNATSFNAVEIANLALEGKRIAWCYSRNRELQVTLTMPATYDRAIFDQFETAVQLRTAKHIARAFGHLWANFDCGAEWADHYNMRREDGYNSSNHPLPTACDVTASGRYSWEVDPDGVVEFEVNRPQGTACRVTGTLDDFVISITKLALDRHLICLFQQLQQVFGLQPDDAIERIETARGFALMGIRGGELHKVVLA